MANLRLPRGWLGKGRGGPRKALAAPLPLFAFHAERAPVRHGKAASLTLLQISQHRRHCRRLNWRVGVLRRRWSPHSRRPENRLLRDGLRLLGVCFCFYRFFRRNIFFWRYRYFKQRGFFWRSRRNHSAGTFNLCLCFNLYRRFNLHSRNRSRLRLRFHADRLGNHHGLRCSSVFHSGFHHFTQALQSGRITSSSNARGLPESNSKRFRILVARSRWASPPPRQFPTGGRLRGSPAGRVRLRHSARTGACGRSPPRVHIPWRAARPVRAHWNRR